MKNFTVIFCLVMTIFGFTLCAKAIEENHKWLYPKQLKVYVPSGHKRTVMMKHAFSEWTKLTGGKFVFKYVTSPSYAKIEVEFVDKIPNADREIGLTNFRYRSSGKMVSAQILIADKTADGRVLGNDSVYTVMLHEIGHAMGITQHSKDPLSIMYPYENDAQEILKSDLKTLAEIYGW